MCSEKRDYVKFFKELLELDNCVPTHQSNLAAEIQVTENRKNPEIMGEIFSFKDPFGESLDPFRTILEMTTY